MVVVFETPKLCTPTVGALTLWLETDVFVRDVLLENTVCACDCYADRGGCTVSVDRNAKQHYLRLNMPKRCYLGVHRGFLATF